MNNLVIGGNSYMPYILPEYFQNNRSRIDKVKTPFLLLDRNTLFRASREYLKQFKQAEVYYSVKANSHRYILETLKDAGIKFDIASGVELDYLLESGVDPEQIIFSAPTKIPEHIEYTYKKGINVFAFDSKLELEKLAKLAPGSNVVARATVPNTGSEWPLDKKFGLDDADVVPLMVYAKDLGLVPYGLTFHVGSQNSRPESWKHAIRKMADLNEGLTARGIRIGLLNAGGGFPASYEKEIPPLSQFAGVILESKRKYFDDGVRLLVEPGRGLVASAGVLATTVINRARRNGKNWLYVDCGVFNGVFEAEQGFRFPLVTEKDNHARELFNVCGPSCDSVDIIMNEVSLPADLALGDRVYFLSAGAYTISYEKYNGLSYPAVVTTP